MGTPIITSIVPGQTWTFNAATGRVTFGVCVLGDYNGNGSLDAADLDLQSVAIKNNGPLATYDENKDGQVNFEDRKVWVKDYKKTYIGDANLNGTFTSTDLIDVFVAGKYETGTTAGWTDGDFNGDMVFGSSDLVAAFVDGGYELPAPAVSAVPEPSSLVLLLLGTLLLVRRRQK